MSRYCPQCGQCYDDDISRCPSDDALLRAVGGEGRLIGTLIADRFRLVEKIGSGGFGKVYRAIQLSMRRDVAIKVLRREFDTDAPHYERFVREATLASSIKHPNVVSPIDFGQDSDQELTYLVMEYIDGVDLGHLLDGWRLSPELALDILYQTCGGLSDAHRQGITHRDLKPRNIRLSVVSDGSLQVKVLDLGIAKPKDAQEDITKQEDRVGTTAFLAPEYLVHGDLADYSDQYALGILLYLMLTGQKPFTGNDHQVMFQHIQSQPPPISEALPAGESVPEAIEELHRRLAAKRPQDRFDDVRTVRERIDEIRDRHDIDTITVKNPPDSVSIQIFEPWLIETEELEEVEVESLPSDLVSQLQGAGAEVVTGEDSNQEKRIVLPTPPPMPADRPGKDAGSTNAADGSSSGISLPKPKSSPSNSGGDSSSGASLSLPKPSPLPTPDARSSSPPPSEDTSSNENRRVRPKRRTEDQSSPQALPPPSPDSTTLPSSTHAEEEKIEAPAPSCGSDKKDSSEASDIELDEEAVTQNESAASTTTAGNVPPLSETDSETVAGLLRNHGRIAAVGAVMLAIVVSGLSLALSSGEDVETTPSEQPASESSHEETSLDEGDEVSKEESKIDEPRETLKESRDAAKDAGEKLARELTAPRGRDIADAVDELQTETSVPEQRPDEEHVAPPEEAQEEDEDEDDLDRLLDEVGRP